VLRSRSYPSPRSESDHLPRRSGNHSLCRVELQCGQASHLSGIDCEQHLLSDLVCFRFPSLILFFSLSSPSTPHQSPRISLFRIWTITRHLIPRNSQHQRSHFNPRFHNLYRMQLWTPLQIPTSRIIEPIRDHPSPAVLWKSTIRYFTSSRSRRRWFEQLFNWWKFDWKRIEWIFDWWNERCEFDQGFECWNRWNRCGYFRSPRLEAPSFSTLPFSLCLYCCLTNHEQMNERTMNDGVRGGVYISCFEEKDTGCFHLSLLLISNTKYHTLLCICSFFRCPLVSCRAGRMCNFPIPCEFANSRFDLNASPQNPLGPQAPHRPTKAIPDSIQLDIEVLKFL